MKSKIKVLFYIWAYVSFSQLSTATEFIPLGFLDANDRVSSAVAVDVVGDAVVGESVVNGQVTAFVWRQNNGMLPLEFANGAVIANSISADGQVIIGRARTAQSSNGESFLTGSSQAFTLIGSLVATPTGSSAQDVSADGSVVAGWSPSSSKAFEAYRWTQQHGLEPLGTLLGGANYSIANAIAPDGDVIVGESGSVEGTQAFRWSQADGMSGIGDLAGGNFSSTALDVSDNGKVIVGDSSSAQGLEAFRWDEVSGMTGLGHLSTTSPRSTALSVAIDGSVIVGTSGDADATAFIWDQSHGMRSLQDFLAADPNLIGDLNGWHLIAAQGVSANGQAIVGRGYNPEGQIEAFLVRLDAPLNVPEPRTLGLLASCCAICHCAIQHRRIPGRERRRE